MKPIDLLILSNGPGEVATWVKPVVREFRQRLGNDRACLRISVVLSPCSNANGQEAAIVQSYPEVDRTQAAADFFPFLLWGKTQENWDWRSRGVVLFLGGDQFYPIAIGKRLGYRTVVYAEWEARWPRWIDRFGIMKPQILDRIPSQYVHKFTIVGDLMAEVSADPHPSSLIPHPSSLIPHPSSLIPHPSSLIPPSPLIAILPGSKPAKLSVCLPLMLAIAEHLHQQRPDLRFAIPVAPALKPETLARYADPTFNPVIQRLNWASATLIESDELMLKTGAGLEVALWLASPAYDRLVQCALCLTTVGANTAELGALAIPMMVVLPTQQLDVMRAWDGLPGLLANLPGVGTGFATVINWLALRRLGLLSWPNIWANEEIVPERVGQLEPAPIAAEMLELLQPEPLEAMRSRLRSVRGAPGAATKLVDLVCEELTAQA